LKASLDNGLIGRGLKWNFAKFLCNAEGVPVKRYFPTTSPLAIESDIIALIEEQTKQ
jgi:glutathione peroxidase